MNKEALAKYEELRSSINANINTIRHLLHQTDMLNSLVMQLHDNEEQKVALEKSIQELYNVINQLIKQTNALFKQLAAFAGGVKVAK